MNKANAMVKSYIDDRRLSERRVKSEKRKLAFKQPETHRLMSLVVEEFQMEGKNVTEKDLNYLKAAMLQKVDDASQKEQIKTVFEALNRKQTDLDLSIDQLNLLSKIIQNIDH